MQTLSADIDSDCVISSQNSREDKSKFDVVPIFADLYYNDQELIWQKIESCKYRVFFLSEIYVGMGRIMQPGVSVI